MPTKSDFKLGGAEQGFRPPPVWNESMQSLKKNLLSLQPYIFNKEKFNNVESKNFLIKEIHDLAQEAKNIRHDPMVSSKDPTVRFVSIQFAEELQKADLNFNTGYAELSRSRLVKVTGYCIECHARLKDGPEFNFQGSEQAYLKQLAVTDQVEFMIAFRQFDSAFNLVITTIKEIQQKKTENFETNRLAQLGLIIAVQYKQDAIMAARITDAIQKNKFLPEFLKRKNLQWKKSLAAWTLNDSLRTLPDVQNLLKLHYSEIEDMRAITALLRILSDDLNEEQLGEALMLTGESYEKINSIYKLSLHENYYESCVRKAPKTKWAELCFNKLNEAF
ncbi:MAG: hypothetical protein WA160_12375 [Pseudobdellovibrio sp.]